MLISEEGLTFDDVLLVPQYSDIKHRHEVDISTQILPQISMKVPYISANMDTITDYRMAFAMAKNGGLGILHRYMDIETMIEQVSKYHKLYEEEGEGLTRQPVILSIGVRDSERLDAAYKHGIRNFCIDVAHGHHCLVKEKIEEIRSKYGQEVGIIAGNVCTYEGVYALFEWGADCAKIGVGPGSVCTTRIKTGAGYPQLSAIMHGAKAKKDYTQKHQGQKVFLIADGGIKYYGDVTKAVAAGADAVMFGSMFAGCKQTPGEVWRNEKEEMIKTFRGMASASAQSDIGIEDINEEGVSLTVKYRGSVDHIITRMSKGLRSGLSYCGAHSIAALQTQAKFIRITQNAVIEGMPHKIY
jgi:IMP dehydrogenase